MNDYQIKLPSPSGEIVKRYLSLLKTDTPYAAYSLDDNLNVIQGQGSIENNGMYSNHKNEDISQDELYFSYTNEYGKGIYTNKWWSLNKAEAVEYQQQNIRRNIGLLQDKIDILKDKL